MHQYEKYIQLKMTIRTAINNYRDKKFTGYHNNPTSGN